MKGDRISGNLQFDVTQNKIRLGETFYQNFGSFLSFGGEKVISLNKINDEYFLNCRFYNKDGDLIFWMSRNRFWAPSTFSVIIRDKIIEITNSMNSLNSLKIWQVDNYLCILGNNYRNGKTISISSDQTNFGGIIMRGGGTMMGNGTNTLVNM